MHATLESFDAAATMMQTLVADVLTTAFLLGTCDPQHHCPVLFTPLEYESHDDERVLVAVSESNNAVLGRGRTVVDFCHPLSGETGAGLRRRFVTMMASAGWRVTRWDVVRVYERKSSWGLLIGVAR